jgi:hypothetical protein
MRSETKCLALTVRAVRAAPVAVPLNFVLGTNQAVIRQASLLLIDVETEEGVTDRNYVFCFMPSVARALIALLGEVEALIKGERATPPVLWDKLIRRFTLMGVQGVAPLAMVPLPRPAPGAPPPSPGRTARPQGQGLHQSRALPCQCRLFRIAQRTGARPDGSCAGGDEPRVLRLLSQ